MAHGTLTGSCAGEPSSSHWRCQRETDRLIPRSTSDAVVSAPDLHSSHQASFGSPELNTSSATRSWLAMLCW